MSLSGSIQKMAARRVAREKNIMTQKNLKIHGGKKNGKTITIVHNNN
jgi:hypothetical protein